ncbi:MAG: HD domain-containing phosphohydrolase [Bdellovibrionota bacterium]|nr:HD domain-containing phosphohydrolase [Bdellovibrionota bacterium]
MKENKDYSYFSISFGLVLLDKELPYDLYINSSTHASREKFVKIFKKENILNSEDLHTFKDKYYQLYVREDERELYLKSLGVVEGAADVEKAAVIKDSAIQYLESLFDEGHEFSNEVLDEAIQGCRDSVESMVDVIQDYSILEVQNLIADLSFHDFYTYDHSINVAMYSISILKALKPDAGRFELLMAGMGGLLHDLGKVKIDTRIINNPGKLSEDDFQVIKKHPEYGMELLNEHQCSHDEINFDLIKKVIGEHHENFNGTGYPNRLKGKEISVLARITAIADFYDAITTKRSYHEVLPTADAIEVMARSVGRKIDPKIFEIFRKNVNVVLEGKSHIELPDDFDPCQPKNILPLQKSAPKIQRSDFLDKEEQGFGKVKKKAS